MLLNGVFGHLKLVLLLVAHIGLAGAANVLAQTQSVSTASSSSSSFGATSTGTHGSNSSSHKKKKLGKGPIGGIAVAVLVLVALALYFIYKRICGKRREVSSSAPVLPQSAPVSSIDEKDSIPPQSPAPPGVTYQPQNPQFQFIPGSNYHPGAPGYHPGYLHA